MPLSLFLAGDVMTGRGVDQVLASPSAPELRESYVRDARDYVTLAAAAHGPVPGPAVPGWPWGDALDILDRLRPDVRLINLETSVTTSDDFADKGINYRMHPGNVGCLTAARLDVASLANNHVLDFGRRGLLETLDTLERAGIACVGAGRTLAEARAPAVVPVRGSSVVVHAVATTSSGVPASWAAGERSPGVHLVELTEAGAEDLLARMEPRPTGDVVTVVSVHAGSNWGYDVPADHVRFAHRLVDGGVDVVHGHSSHHPRPVEVHRGALVLYGCGDLVNDYEGISGRESFRSDLRLLHVVTLEPGPRSFRELRMVPVRARRLRLERATDEETRWLHATMVRTCHPFGTEVELDPAGTLVVRDRRE